MCRCSSVKIYANARQKYTYNLPKLFHKRDIVVKQEVKGWNQLDPLEAESGRGYL